MDPTWTLKVILSLTFSPSLTELQAPHAQGDTQPKIPEDLLKISRALAPSHSVIPSLSLHLSPLWYSSQILAAWILMSVSSTQYELWALFGSPSLHYISKVPPKWNNYRAHLIYFLSVRITSPVVQYLKVVIFCFFFWLSSSWGRRTNPTISVNPLWMEEVPNFNFFLSIPYQTFLSGKQSIIFT